MAFPNDGKKFKKGESGNLKGRPRKYVSTLTDLGYSKSEVNDCIMALMAMNTDELDEAFANPTATVLEKTLANAIKVGIQNGNLSSIETLLDRVYGKPKQEIEQKITKLKPPKIQFYGRGDNDEEE